MKLKNTLLCLSLVAYSQAFGQTTRTWTGSSGAAYLTGSNWSPTGTYAGGAPLITSAAEGLTTDILAVAAANTATNIGINMNTLTAGNGGVGLSLGGINFDKTSTVNLQIGNSSTTVNGILQINGATINSTANTLIRVTGSANLTIANVNSGAGTQTMGLRLGITNGIFDVNTSRTLTISSAISQVSADSGFTKTGAGTLTLSGTNTYTGTTAVSAGTLLVNGNTASATGNVTIASGATLGGTGTVGGATTISGTHSPGSAAGTVGTQAFSSSLTYGTGSIFNWDLNANSTTTTFDTVSATGAIAAAGGVFNVVLGTGVDQTAAFWAQPGSSKTWALATIFGKALESTFSSVTVTGATPAFTALGGFRINGTTLTWQAVPEPSSALAGLLLGAGLLRRRRAA